MNQAKNDVATRNKAYRYRIYPSPDQLVMIRKTFGCVRFLYNQMLEERRRRHEQPCEGDEEQPKRKYRSPAAFKVEFEWLREVDSLALCNAELHLKSAFRNHIRDKRRFGYPKFKSRKNPVQSYTTNNQRGTIRISEDGKSVRCPKLGEIRVKLHRQIPEHHTIKSATISCSASGSYYISILTEYLAKRERLEPHTDRILGLDYSSRELYIDHTGYSAGYPKYYRKMEGRLKKAQRVLSRRTRGGSNWRKQKQRVARLHEKVSNQRRDFLHKESNRLSEEWDAVIVEDLNMQGMSQKLSLGKPTMDNGNGLFRMVLEYKLADRGKQLIKIDKWFPSSRRCECCGRINTKLTLKDRVWTCEYCGTSHQRDVNAARNIRTEGIRILGLE